MKQLFCLVIQVTFKDGLAREILKIQPSKPGSQKQHATWKLVDLSFKSGTTKKSQELVTEKTGCLQCVFEEAILQSIWCIPGVFQNKLLPYWDNSATEDGFNVTFYFDMSIMIRPKSLKNLCLKIHRKSLFGSEAPVLRSLSPFFRVLPRFINHKEN